MKKLIYSLLAVGLLLTSCSSDQSGGIPDVEIPETKKHIVTINLEGVEGKMNSTRATNNYTSFADAGISHMDYIVTDASKGFRKEVYYQGDNIPTIIKDTLPEGIYSIQIVASTNEKGRTDNRKPYYYAPTEGYIHRNYLCDADFFQCQFDLEVNSNNIVKKEQVLLDRMVSRINILPTDLNNIPENLTSILFVIENASFQDSQWGWIRNSSNLITTCVELTKEELLLINQENPISFTSFKVSSSIENGSLPFQGYHPLVVYKYFNDQTFEKTVIKAAYFWGNNTIYEYSGDLFPTTRTTRSNMQWNETIKENLN